MGLNTDKSNLVERGKIRKKRRDNCRTTVLTQSTGSTISAQVVTSDLKQSKNCSYR